MKRGFDVSIRTALAGLVLMFGLGRASARAAEKMSAPSLAPLGNSETTGLPVEDDSTDETKKVEPKVHTVVKGDTLWDLSQHYLGNPWYWPKVWSYNPEIANPHWIYPGSRIRILPAMEEVPARVDGSGAVASETIRPSTLVADSADAVFGDPPPPVQVMGNLRYNSKPGMHLLRNAFVTSRELDESAVIDSSFAETLMLSTGDVVYLSFKKNADVHVGDQYMIFRTEAEVRHPLNNERQGYLTRVLGALKVLSPATQGKLVRARIVEAYEPINRQDMVGPSGEKLLQVVQARSNDQELDGYVLASVDPGKTLLGEYQEIVIDKGSADSVLPGNTFNIVRQGNLVRDFVNPALSKDSRYPVENIASCIAVDVKEHATTCLLTRSLREVVWGDRAQMRRSGSSGPLSQR